MGNAGHAKPIGVAVKVLLSAVILFFCLSHARGPIDSDEAFVFDLCQRPQPFSLINPFNKGLGIPVVDLHGIIGNYLSCASIKVFGPSIFAARLPALVVLSGLLIFLFWMSEGLPMALGLTLFGMIAANGELLWYGASTRGYGLAILITLLMLYVYRDIAQNRPKILLGLGLVCCLTNAPSCMFLLIFVAAFFLAEQGNRTDRRVPGRYWLPLLPIALLIALQTVLQHRSVEVRTDPRAYFTFLSLLGGVFGMPRAVWGLAILASGGIALFAVGPKLKKLNEEPFTFAGLLAFPVIFGLTIGVNRNTPVRTFLPLALPLVFFLFNGIGEIQNRQLRTIGTFGLVLLFAVVPHFYRQDTFDQRHSVLRSDFFALVAQAREIQKQDSEACFAYEGGPFEKGWLRHFGSHRGNPRLKECDDQIKYVLSWRENQGTLRALVSRK